MMLGYGNDYLWGMIHAKNQARDLEAENARLRAENEELNAEIKKLKKRIAELEHKR
jgi:cell division protein FtsB